MPTPALAKDVAKALASVLAQVDEARASLAIVDPDLRSRVRSSFEAEVAGPMEVIHEIEFLGSGNQLGRRRGVKKAL